MLRGMKWTKFNPRAVKLPPERRYVLVQIEADKDTGMPSSIVVGYLRKWSEKREYYFVTPGFQGRGYRKITHWSDCLGNDFEAPLWAGKQKC